MKNKNDIMVVLVLLAMMACFLGCAEKEYVKTSLSGNGNDVASGSNESGSARDLEKKSTAVKVLVDASDPEAEPAVVTPPSGEGPKAGKKGKPKSYIIKAGDKIEVSVFGEGRDMTKSILVRPDGKISYVYIDEMQAAGLTIKKLKEQITEKLKDYFRSPEVSVLLTAPTGHIVTILGEVNKPGRYSIKNDTRLLDLIAIAGGIRYGRGVNEATQETADLKRAYIVRDKTVLNVKFEKILDPKTRPTTRDLSANDILMQPGDRVYIPSVISQDNKIFVVGGGVGRNLVIRYAKNISFWEAITEAGGVTKAAWERKAYIVRGRFQKPTVMAINSRKIMEGKARDFYLERGDIVVVPIHPLQKIADIIGYASTILSFGNLADDTFNTYKGHPIKRPE